ncbi:hypothetical protein ART_3179 [Arthrobacter sp. PAMC 25486]|nr:hypothetical protein ART_3179 [Arthrobacter sp. PAMC 25486]
MPVPCSGAASIRQLEQTGRVFPLKRLRLGPLNQWSGRITGFPY